MEELIKLLQGIPPVILVTLVVLLLLLVGLFIKISYRYFERKFISIDNHFGYLLANADATDQALNYFFPSNGTSYLEKKQEALNSLLKRNDELNKNTN
jgi:hypothetical protein